MSYPGVSFHADGTRVVVLATVGVPKLPKQRTYETYFECGHEYAAELLAAHLCDQYTEAIREVKQSAYRLGYRDGRAKRKKRTQFCGDLDPSESM